MVKVAGSGSLIPLDKTVPEGKCRHWEMRVSVGKDPKTGKYKPRTRKFHGTKTEGKKALRQFISDIENNIDRPFAHMEFCDAAELWQRMREDPSSRLYVSYGTSRKGPAHIKCLNMHLAHMDVGAITYVDMEDVYKKLMDGDSPSGKPLKGTYVALIHSTANLIFKWLQSERVISVNPCESAKPPKNDTEERKALPSEGIEAVISQIEPDSGTNTAILLDIMLGLRSCEACALDWSDVDFRKRTISVKKSNNGKEVRDHTKTDAGMRVLPMVDGVRDMLERRRSIQEAQFEARRTDLARKKKDGYTPVMEPSLPVCCDTRGRRTTPHSVSTSWRRMRAELGFAGYTPHELRHSYLTSLYRKGVDLKTLQKIGGHAHYSTAVDIYVHTTIDDMREAMSL